MAIIVVSEKPTYITGLCVYLSAEPGVAVLLNLWNKYRLMLQIWMSERTLDTYRENIKIFGMYSSYKCEKDLRSPQCIAMFELKKTLLMYKKMI